MRRRILFGILCRIVSAVAIAVPAIAQDRLEFSSALPRAQGQQLLQSLCKTQGKLCRTLSTGTQIPGLEKPGTSHPFMVGIDIQLAPNSTSGSGKGMAPAIVVNSQIAAAGGSGFHIQVVGPNVQPAPGNIEQPRARVLARPYSPTFDNPFDLVVAITFKVAGVPQICTGTLLDPTHVLTAGHCGCGDPTSYQVHFADKYLDSLSQPGKPPVLFDARVCSARRYAGHDLALLELQRGITCPLALRFQNQVRMTEGGPVVPEAVANYADCRSDALQSNLTTPALSFGFPPAKFWDLQSKLPKGKKLTVVGYGYTNSGGIGVRMQDAIPIASVACTEARLASVCAPYAEMILAEALGPTIRNDTCEGDSGGPVFLMEEGNYTLVAVTSRAAPGVQDDLVHHCGGGGIYTLIGRLSVQEWFRANGIGASQLGPPM